MTFKRKRKAAIAEDMRKIGTTALAASLVSLFITEQKLLTSCAFISGCVIWLLGVFLTDEDD